MIEPIFNEVSQTLSKALNGKIDIIERRHDPANDLEYIDDDDDVDDEDDDYDEDGGVDAEDGDNVYAP